MPQHAVIEQQLASRRLVSPSIPGPLTLREVPAMLTVLRKTAAHAGRAHPG